MQPRKEKQKDCNSTTAFIDCDEYPFSVTLGVERSNLSKT
jgi:hypothetical protein